jgi:hypothetical protein
MVRRAKLTWSRFLKVTRGKGEKREEKTHQLFQFLQIRRVELREVHLVFWFLKGNNKKGEERENMKGERRGTLLIFCSWRKIWRKMEEQLSWSSSSWRKISREREEELSWSSGSWRKIWRERGQGRGGRGTWPGGGTKEGGTHLIFWFLKANMKGESTG